MSLIITNNFFLLSKVANIKGKQCFRDVCITNNYLVEFDPANFGSPLYQDIWASMFVNDVKEVNVEHHHITLGIGLVMTWRDTRMSCKKQVTAN